MDAPGGLMIKILLPVVPRRGLGGGIVKNDYLIYVNAISS